MRWELLFCHSFWNDIKIQTSSMAIECEGSLYSEQLLAAPVCDRLPHYHFAQQERTQLNSPSEKTENSLGLLTFLSSAARRAASWGPGSFALPKQGAEVPCAGWQRTASEGSVSKLPRGPSAHDAARKWEAMPIPWFLPPTHTQHSVLHCTENLGFTAWLFTFGASEGWMLGIVVRATRRDSATPLGAPHS